MHTLRKGHHLQNINEHVCEELNISENWIGTAARNFAERTGKRNLLTPEGNATGVRAANQRATATTPSPGRSSTRQESDSESPSSPEPIIEQTGTQRSKQDGVLQSGGYDSSEDDGEIIESTIADVTGRPRNQSDTRRSPSASSAGWDQHAIPEQDPLDDGVLALLDEQLCVHKCRHKYHLIIYEDDFVV